MAKNQPLKRAIEDIKIRYNLKQEEIASKLDVTDRHLSGVINGHFTLSEGLTEKIYEIFHIIVNEVHEDEPKYERNLSINYIPLLPISAQAGSLNDFIVAVKDKEEHEQIISPIKGADFAISVSGESMAPEYPNGSQILVKKINEKAFIEWGKVYVLDTVNGAIIKRIVPSEVEGSVKCLSINPNPVYAPFEVSMNDIYGIYRVMLCMSVK